MTKIGIMQGRLVSPEPNRFQAFPRNRWLEEFSLAVKVPLSYIEWIYDAYGADVNPVLHAPSAVRAAAIQSGVSVRALCADYFMDYPFVRCPEADYNRRRDILLKLLTISPDVGINRIVLPFVDASRIETQDDTDRVVRLLNEVLGAAETRGIEIHLETALGPGEFARLLERVPSAQVRVNYDSGNSASLGFRPAEEFAAYGNRIGSVHIKDRLLGGGTVPLGTGDVDFPSLFNCLRRIGYEGDMTLQVARPSSGDEVSWARSNREFVARYWTVE